MPTVNAGTSLESIALAVLADPGLPANIYAADIAGGAAASRLINSVMLTAIARTGVNADGIITEADLMAVSDAIRADPALYDKFLTGHGNDEGDVETGFHLVQGDGGAFRFQGRDFVDTVADAIYHVGFTYSGGRFVNEDGNANEEVADVAGWLNYFLNGVNRVFGSAGDDSLHSGSYSFYFAAAANETFDAGAGNDGIWAGDGNDTVYGGTGDDSSGGGTGNDLIYGGAGNDSLGGDAGADAVHGQSGNDGLGGGLGDDRLYGGLGDDQIWGDEGADLMDGGDGLDTLGGGAGQ